MDNQERTASAVRSWFDEKFQNGCFRWFRKDHAAFTAVFCGLLINSAPRRLTFRVQSVLYI